MEKRLNFNKEVDDMTKINEFFQNHTVPSEMELLKPSTTQTPKTESEQIKSA